MGAGPVVSHNSDWVPPDAPVRESSALADQITALQREISALNTTLSALSPALERLAGLVDSPPDSAPSTLLARLNGERLNAEVMRRTARGIDPDNDTELDLLIDRLHDLSDSRP